MTQLRHQPKERRCNLLSLSLVLSAISRREFEDRELVEEAVRQMTKEIAKQSEEMTPSLLVNFTLSLGKLKNYQQFSIDEEILIKFGEQIEIWLKNSRPEYIFSFNELVKLVQGFSFINLANESVSRICLEEIDRLQNSEQDSNSVSRLIYSLQNLNLGETRHYLSLMKMLKRTRSDYEEYLEENHGSLAKSLFFDKML